MSSNSDEAGKQDSDGVSKSFAHPNAPPEIVNRESEKNSEQEKGAALSRKDSIKSKHWVEQDEEQKECAYMMARISIKGEQDGKGEDEQRGR